MEYITIWLMIESILLIIGLFTSIKWVCWHLINDTEIIERIGNFITRSNDDKKYYIESYNRVFNLVKTVILIAGLVFPFIHLLFLGMRVIV